LPCHAQAPWNKSTSYDRSDVDSDSSKNVSPWERPASPPQQVQQYRYEVKHPTASKAILLDSPEIRQSNPAEIRYLGNGTEVEVLATVPDQKIPALSWYRVLVKNGNMRGSVGYISATNIRLMGGPSPSGPQRGGQFSTNSADERIGGTSQASTTNKTGYTMKNSALLLSEPDISKSTQKEFQVGTAVTGTRLELLGVIPDPNITPMKWFYVRMLDGQLAGNTGYVSATNVRDDGRGNPLNTANSRGVTLTEASGSAKSTDSNQYVLKTGALIVTEPKYANVAEKSKQVGFAITGTRLQLLDQAPTADGAMSWRRVLVLSGDMKGREGWVSTNLLEQDIRLFLNSLSSSLNPLAIYESWKYKKPITALFMTTKPADAVAITPFCVVEVLRNVKGHVLFNGSLEVKPVTWATWSTTVPQGKCGYTLEDSMKYPDLNLPVLDYLLMNELTWEDGEPFTKTIRRWISVKRDKIPVPFGLQALNEIYQNVEYYHIRKGKKQVLGSKSYLMGICSDDKNAIGGYACSSKYCDPEEESSNHPLNESKKELDPNSRRAQLDRDKMGGISLVKGNMLKLSDGHGLHEMSCNEEGQAGKEASKALMRQILLQIKSGPIEYVIDQHYRWTIPW
jgi:hypothetical protein